jgi:hypothetical protein
VVGLKILWICEKCKKDGTINQKNDWFSTSQLKNLLNGSHKIESPNCNATEAFFQLTIIEK